MNELLPCPFCGGKAEIVHIDEGENAGGSCVSCTACMASGNVEFERKENFVSNWNRRDFSPLTLPAALLVEAARQASALQAHTRAPVTDEELEQWANLRADDAGRLARELIAYRRASPPPQSNVLPSVAVGQMEIDPDTAAAELGVNAEPAEDDPPCTCCQDTGYDGNRERFCDCTAGIDALAATQQQLWGDHLRATGIARDPENDRTVFLSLTRTPNDDELRAIHDAIRRVPANCPFCQKPTYILPCSHCGEPDIPDDQY